MAKMKGKSKDSLLNREVGEGSGASIKQDNSHDVGAEGYHRAEFGGNEDENYRIADGYRVKDESPSRSEDSNIHEIAHHSVTGELYSGEPDAHGHKGKVAAANKAGVFALSKSKGAKGHEGGGKNEEEI